MFEMLVKLLKKFLFSPETRARMAGVVMGDKCFVAGDFWSSEPYLIRIGDCCQITRGVKIHTHGGGAAVRLKYPKFDCFGKVTIGNYVYLGNDVSIMPGVSIGNNVIVAACSVVTKSIPNDVVVGGNPAKIICSIDDYIEKNLKYNLNTSGMSAKEKKKILLDLPCEKFIQKKQMEIK